MTGIKKSTRERAVKSGKNRGKGIIGPNAVTPRYVREHTPKTKSILDFGAGEDAYHTLFMRNMGFTRVTAYDFPENRIKGLHDPNALDYTYDVVMASNVLNVQETVKMLKATLEQLFGAMDPASGILYANYTGNPRYIKALTPGKLKKIIESYGYHVQRVGGDSGSPIWAIYFK